MCKSLKRESNHIISHVTFPIDMYLTSTKDLDTVCYFFDFQETKESPINTQKLLIDFLVSRQKVQSESTNPFNSIDNVHEKKRPYSTILLTY